ncbi:biliverdin-producing heme oxygenase [Chryseobacterium binzhouense]|uniref:biliverdin-producing heme oxygenase n=1 Tax=Chryseobacterium binzhouense TaxID=2593646 RepID=UPI00117CCC62|nr:biliverdin-producing heme oxygenase [Chryseobacterium binzhouense]
MLSEYLKKNTAEYHDTAEKLFQSHKIFTKTFTLNDYKKIIYNNYLMLLHSEEKIFNLLNETYSEKLQLENRKKFHLIEKDFLTLQLKNDSTFSFDISNESEALGALYVIEGSTLGGNVIAKQLSKTEGFEDISFYFFGCYQEKTGTMWKSFKEVLDNQIKEENHNKVLSGAKKMYEFLINIG